MNRNILIVLLAAGVAACDRPTRPSLSVLLRSPDSIAASIIAGTGSQFLTFEAPVTITNLGTAPINAFECGGLRLESLVGAQWQVVDGQICTLVAPRANISIAPGESRQDTFYFWKPYPEGVAPDIGPGTYRVTVDLFADDIAVTTKPSTAFELTVKGP